MKIAKIAIPKQKLFHLDYLADHSYSIGEIVKIPFRGEILLGIITSLEDNSKLSNLKQIISSYEPKTILSKNYLHFLKMASSYYFTEIGSIAKMALPLNLSAINPKEIHQEFSNIDLISLSQEQEDSLEKIDKQGVTLLHGETGSGKTEIYFHLIHSIIKEGRQALFMLPEIALTRQMITRFEERFKEKAVIWNAGISKSKKERILKSVLSGEIKVIIGARSALFLPYKDLGIIIVDEEHDASYKQEEQILYNARDMAVLRGSICKFPVILGSATPSIESLYNAQNKKYNYVTIKSRYGNATLPNIFPIDMRKEGKNRWISNSLEEKIKACVSQGQQAMLFLNRKGYSPVLVCTSCGFKPYCSSCSSNLVYHKAKSKLICHHCGYWENYNDECADCHTEQALKPCGPGIEKIFEEAQSIFKDANIQIMTKEEMASHKRSKAIITDIEEGKIDIIIGTQIITKGYHFPKLTLVGVIDTDIALNSSELKASENNFALLYQLSGRAGREEIQGNIYMQTYNPESHFIAQLQKHDFLAFIDNELESRKSANMPPIFKIASLILEDKNEIDVRKKSLDIVKSMRKTQDIVILGPAPAFMSKLKNKYRYRIIIIAKSYQILHHFLAKTLNSLNNKIKKDIKIDIDPYNFS